MRRKCDCAGPCGPIDDRYSRLEPLQFAADGVSRRDFLALAGAAAGLTVGAGRISAAPRPQAISDAEMETWIKSLRGASAPRVYRSGVEVDAQFPLGGIGTGVFFIGSDGHLTSWQLFNTLRDGYIPFFFGARAGNKAKILQTAGGPEGLPRIKSIAMTGDYPIATLRYEDAELPVHIEMNAFSPMAPLDTRLSSMPVACFVFKVHNPTDQLQTVSLGAFMQNPVGYDALGPQLGFHPAALHTLQPRLDVRHPNFGGNFNEAHAGAAHTALVMRAKAGDRPTLSRAIDIYTNLDARALRQPFNDRPADLRVEPLAAAANARPGGPDTIVWLEDAPLDLHEATLRRVRELVDAGATLVFSGDAHPLLRHYGELTKGKPFDSASVRPDTIFEDFENGYANWTVTGSAFGLAPAPGTLGGQQRVTGFLGRSLVNSFSGGDDTTGKLVSKPFTIERRFVRFLVGGGSSRATQIRLVVGGRVVRATSGRDDERLEPAAWEVSEFVGKSAHIEIVDEATGGWGHINVDQIEFGDTPGSGAVLSVLDELLPIRFTGVEQEGGRTRLVGVTQKPGAASTTIGDTLPAFKWKLGAGTVIVAAGAILPPGDVELTGARQRAYAKLAATIGADYTGPHGQQTNAPGFGDAALAVMGGTASALPEFTDWAEAWKPFAESGAFPAIEGDRRRPTSTPPGETVNGALATTIHVPAGKTIDVAFLMSWRYPNMYNSEGVAMGTHYATLWPSAHAVVQETADNWPSIRGKTERFRETFYDSTLPWWLLDCVTSQISTIRHSGVIFRIANGDIYGWEGSNGCCGPTCTHVYGYEQTLARVFPDLEREMRRIDYKHQQFSDGGIHNRTAIPSPPFPSGENPFTDGHASCILKAYREALNCSDESWLHDYWPGIKLAVQYLINRDAKTSGGKPNGLLEDDQFNTYDEALHGVTSFIGTYYLASLRVGEELARRMGDRDFAERCRAIFTDGQKNLIEKCWNGEYFQQSLPNYANMGGEVGPGCMSDQMIGQWWAHQLGLGYLLPPEYVKKSLQAVFKYNFKDLTGWRQIPRQFASDGDKGLIICTWPKGGRPRQVMLYSDEIWTGIEYQVAAHMAYEGMIERCFAITKGARDRYDGRARAPITRNPWNEIECGGHYARAMSSWSLLLALSGFELDGPAGRLRFSPRHAPEKFKSLFTGPESWGSIAQTRAGTTQKNTIMVAEGRIRLTRLHLDTVAEPSRVRMVVAAKDVRATISPAPEGHYITPAAPVILKKGEALTVTLS